MKIEYMNLQGVFPPIMPHFSYVFIAWLQLVNLIGFTPESRNLGGGRKESAYDPKRTSPYQ